VIARTVTGEGMADKSDPAATYRYYAYKCGPTLPAGRITTYPVPGCHQGDAGVCSPSKGAADSIDSAGN